MGIVFAKSVQNSNLKKKMRGEEMRERENLF
jgi:hypothetical protein